MNKRPCAIAGAIRKLSDHGEYSKSKKYTGEIERPNTQYSPHPEFSDVDFIKSLFLHQEQICDKEATEDEEEIYSYTTIGDTIAYALINGVGHYRSIVRVEAVG